ncbi:MAG: hypothetical protein AAGF89_00290 [Bacteroidota bacterium]
MAREGLRKFLALRRVCCPLASREDHFVVGAFRLGPEGILTASQVISEGGSPSAAPG